MLEKIPQHLSFGQLHHQRETGLRILLQSRRPDHSRMAVTGCLDVTVNTPESGNAVAGTQL